MSWDEDSYPDGLDEPRPPRTAGRTDGWQVARRVLAYAGVVAGVVALAVGAVFAVNVAGLAAKPAGFEAPPAKGPSVALPPIVTSPSEPADAVAAQPEIDDEPSAVSNSAIAPMPVVDPGWTSRIAAATGIPERALSAYASAHIALAEEQPDCGLDWATIAAIGAIESNHGRHGAAVLDENGYSAPAIIGRALDGDGVAAIADTDGGLLDGDDTWDRAVGPMQFIPSTWAKWGSDANGDGIADPNQIDDAAQATARYLCATGPMTSPDGWRAAVFSYNHDNDYVDLVARFANRFAAAALGQG